MFLFYNLAFAFLISSLFLSLSSSQHLRSIDCVDFVQRFRMLPICVLPLFHIQQQSDTHSSLIVLSVLNRSQRPILLTGDENLPLVVGLNIIKNPIYYTD